MKNPLVLNHSLAGFGSDEQAQLKPSGKKAPFRSRGNIATIFTEARSGNCCDTLLW